MNPSKPNNSTYFPLIFPRFREMRLRLLLLVIIPHYRILLSIHIAANHARIFILLRKICLALTFYLLATCLTLVWSTYLFFIWKQIDAMITTEEILRSFHSAFHHPYCYAAEKFAKNVIIIYNFFSK